jgi:asparagine synthase (glutamine-hydrolysing)
MPRGKGADVSGICGLYNLDASPVTADELSWMTSMLRRRGPEQQASWLNDTIGLGHTLLATTPEAVRERLPLRHEGSGCVITADVRLDNRDELIAELRLRDRHPMGDAELLLESYLRWGARCVEQLLGDFAFGIWDPRTETLFCARDQMGMRPFYYHHTPGQFVAFASEPKAILVLPRTPYRIREERIADYLVSELEGIDKTSTFFEELHRLPPAHTLSASAQGLKVERYWRLDPQDELQLRTDQEYAEQFLSVLTEATRSRLRSDGQVGSMLSGGVDSGSIVAIARSSPVECPDRGLPTFSAVTADPASCVETRTIHAALEMEGLVPHLVGVDELSSSPELDELSWALDEPFDLHMTLLRALYQRGREAGSKVMLDGVAGDTVLSEGDYLNQLLTSGRWLRAFRVAVGQNQFFGGAYPPAQELYRGLRSVLAPEPLRRLRGSMGAERRAQAAIERSFIDPDFARRVALGERLEHLRSHAAQTERLPYPRKRARAIEHPYLTVGRERYDRAASAFAIEPRDPFTDRRVVEFAVRLPGHQLISDDGWPKAILRRALEGRLPDEVRYRRGKEHLGATFTASLMAAHERRFQERLDAYLPAVAPYVDLERHGALRPDADQTLLLYGFVQLGAWLHDHTVRPRPPRST